MVGNVWEWTTGQHNNGAGRDNGIDGLWYGISVAAASGYISGYKVDLLRAYPSSSALSTVSYNSDYYYYGVSSRGSIRGGNWSDGVTDGRWDLALESAITRAEPYIGLRCGL